MNFVKKDDTLWDALWVDNIFDPVVEDRNCPHLDISCLDPIHHHVILHTPNKVPAISLVFNWETIYYYIRKPQLYMSLLEEKSTTNGCFQEALYRVSLPNLLSSPCLGKAFMTSKLIKDSETCGWIYTVSKHS